MKHFYRFISIIFVLIFVVTFLIGVFNYNYFEEIINFLIHSYGFFAVFAISFLTEFIPQYAPPHVVIFGGFLFNFNMLYVCFLAVLGSILGSVLSFEIGIKIKKHVVEDLAGKENNKKIKYYVDKWGALFIIIAAISPLPFIPLVFGSIHVSRRVFYLYGLISRSLGIIILSIFLVYVI